MFTRLIQICSTLLFACTLTTSSPVFAANDGIVMVKSAYPIGETIERLKKDIADKGIKFFNEIATNPSSQPMRASSFDPRCC
jgi:hypothetical protein